MMQKINMIGGGFQFDVCSSGNNKNKYVEWVKDGSANISIHIDREIFYKLHDNRVKKYAWIAESSAIIPDVINRVKSQIHILDEIYELIFTHDKRLLPISNKMRFVIPNACPWIQDRQIHPKHKLVSMIASQKQMCDGHKYRVMWLNKLQNQIDTYGRNHNPIVRKEYGLNDYYFSVAIENDNYPSIFCEKITDCFATGTIPIFWGSPDIGEFFNENGIITLTDDFDVNSLSIDLYQSKMDAIQDNFEKTISFSTAEDYIYLNYIK